MKHFLSVTNLSIGYHSKPRHRNKPSEKKYFGETIVQRNLNFRLESSSLTCLLGRNGSGKSTLLKTLSSFLPALSGNIEIMGKPATSYSASELSRLIGVVLTEKTNAGGITVRELVAMGRHPYTGFFGSLSDEDYSIVEHSMKVVDILFKADNYVSELSDGERQKAMIAKALAQECPIIILDEPTAFLDITSRIEIMIFLKKLAREQHRAILLSSHDMDTALQMSDKIWLMCKADKVSVPSLSTFIEGSPEELISNGSINKFFDSDISVFDKDLRKFRAR
ncbi:MAG: ABC transporter ATP-binding protein [Bacteroidales bacterium]